MFGYTNYSSSRRLVFFALAVLAGTLVTHAARAGSSGGGPRALELRLVFIQRNLTQEHHVAEIRDLVTRASGLGFNGIVLSGSFDRISLQGEEYLTRLREVKRICDENGVELIPLMFSAGYASGVLAHDRNLAAALPVKGVPFVITDRRGVLVRDRAIGISNGGFERADGDRAAGFDLQDGPGKRSHIDQSVRREGSSSLRFDDVSRAPRGMGRVMQRVRVSPFRCYKVTLAVKTQDLEPSNRFQVAVMTADGRVLMTDHPSLDPTNDWKQVSLAFNSLSYDEVRIFVGAWSGPTGRFWIDDLRLEEVGILNVVRRAGTPVAVRNAATGEAYREGVDYARIEDSVLSYKVDHDEPVLRAIPDGAIRDGDSLRVEYYQALALKLPSGQNGVCLSEPRVYEVWTEAARMVHEAIAPRHYFVSMDEVRQGGWCETCTRRGLTAGELLGDCIARQREIVRGIDSGAEVLVWSDMLDPNHNATGDYYLINGDLSGSWEHVPKDLIIACWKYDIRDKSLKHFDRLGFRTIGCAYYDVDSKDRVKDWVSSLEETAGSCGIMYTTWRSRYEFLEPFARLAAGAKAGPGSK